MNSRLLKIGIVLLIIALLALCVGVAGFVMCEHPWDDLEKDPWTEADLAADGEHPWDDLCNKGDDPDWEHPWDDRI